MSKEKTNIGPITEAALDELFGPAKTQTAESVNFFQRGDDPTNILNSGGDPNEEEEEEEEEEDGAGGEGGSGGDNGKEGAPKTGGEGEEEEEEGQVNPLDDNAKAQSAPGSKTGRTIYSAINELVKADVLLLYEDDKGKVKPIEEYSKKELVDLITENVARVQEETAKKAPIEFFESMPEDIQTAISYHMNGGTDFKGFFRQIAEAKESEDIDVTTPQGQEKTVRLFLSETGFGTPDEIEAEITEMKDRAGELAKKAAQFKPKLDATRQNRIAATLKNQENQRKNEAKAEETFKQNVYNVLSKGELDGIKLTPAIQGIIYQSTVGSLKTLGQLLTENDIKTNLEHIAEVMWLLRDPKSFKEAYKGKGENGAARKLFTKVKTAGEQKQTSGSTERRQPTRTMKKAPANIFERPTA